MRNKAESRAALPNQPLKLDFLMCYETFFNQYLSLEILIQKGDCII